MSTAGIVALLSEADFGVYAMSLDQRIVFWNRSAERILGYTANEVVGRHCYEVVAGLTEEGLTPACLGGCPSMRALQAGSVPGTARMRMLCSTGERRTVSLTPMVISGAMDDSPLLVHLFEAREEQASPDTTLNEMRQALSRNDVDIVSDHPAPAPPSATAAALTRRELEVLQLVAVGRATADISEEMGISEHTVRNHVRNLRGKLNASTKLEAVLTALRQGILELNEERGGSVGRP